MANFEGRLLLSVPEAAHAVGIGRSRFYEEIQAGRITVTRIGRRVLISTRALAEWAARMEQEAGGAK
jgi:excisionase family DNA binding protein